MFASIVIPIYNVEEYLEKCLDSVLRQGLDSDDYEVILVNDGSKDSSEEICRKYCEAHSNFRLITQQNAGVAAARNRGIEETRGEYVVFLDADDYLLDRGLELASCRFREQKDVDIIHFYSSYDFWPVKAIDNTVDFDGTGHDFIMKFGLPSFCWLFFYRKSFLEEHGLRFQSYVVGEDQLFSSSMCIANPHIVSTKADIYRYVVREQSATTKRDVGHTRRCVNDYLDAYQDILQCMQKYGVLKNSPVYEKCSASLNSKKMFGVSRIWSADYNREDFNAVKGKSNAMGFTPVVYPANGLRRKIEAFVVNLSLKSYIAYRLMSALFNHIVVPYVLPKLRKNLRR